MGPDYSTMKSYACLKCGLRASSKGPGRSMIPGFASIGSTVLKGQFTFNIEPDPYREGQSDLVVRMTTWTNDKNTNTREAAIMHLWGLMQELTEEDMKQGTCDHEWKLDPPDQVE